MTTKLYFATLFICLFLSTNSLAEGAVDGIGVKTCASMLSDIENKPDSLIQYSSWLSGYISATNSLSKDTFDLTSWQSSDFLMRGLAGYCQKNKDIRFFKAVDEMIKSLYSQRLTESSKIVKINSDTQEMLIYVTVLEKLKAELIRLGHIETQNAKIDEARPWDATLSMGIKSFQTERGLLSNGLPDQATLNILFNR